MKDKDLLYAAWVLISNAGGGNWQDTQTPEWIDAAEKWRNEWHATLPKPPTEMAP